MLTQEQKLKAIIEKAVGNGYKDRQYLKDIGRYREGLIFSHDFAKAFWGEEEIENMVEVGNDNYSVYEPQQSIAWQYQIQQLALTPDDERIDYLYKFI